MYKVSWKLFAVHFNLFPFQFFSPGKICRHVAQKTCQLHHSCSKAVQPEGLLPVCCINYKASFLCPCKFYCVLYDVFRLQPLLVSMSIARGYIWKQ